MGNTGWEGKVAKTANKQGIPRYIIDAGVFLVACVVATGVTLFLRDRNEKEMLSQLERSQADLRMLGGQIANIKTQTSPRRTTSSARTRRLNRSKRSTK